MHILRSEILRRQILLLTASTNIEMLMNSVMIIMMSFLIDYLNKIKPNFFWVTSTLTYETMVLIHQLMSS